MVSGEQLDVRYDIARLWCGCLIPRLRPFPPIPRQDRTVSPKGCAGREQGNLESGWAR